MRLWIPICVALLSSGCVTQLDHSLNRLHESRHHAERTFAALVSHYSLAADELARKKHELQELHLQRDWREFLESHTSSDGDLVSRAPDGSLKPLSAETLAAAMDARDLKRSAIDESRASWSAVHTPMQQSIGRFEAMIEASAETEADVQAARESMQTFIDAALGAVAGVAVGAAAVP